MIQTFKTTKQVNMAQNVMKGSEINVENLKFSPPKKLPNGGNKVYVNTDSGNTLYVQTPRVNVLWDTKFYSGDNEDSGNYPIEFSLSNLEGNTSMKEFYDMLVSFDEHLVSLAYENRKEWFGGKYAKHTRETIESLYTPMIKVSIDKNTGEPNGKYPPRFGFKINMWEGKHQCKVYDDSKQLFEIDDKSSPDYKSLKDDVLLKGSNINVLLKCHGIWIINGKFGCTWRAEQIKVKVQPKDISGYAFRDDDDDDDDVVQNDVEMADKQEPVMIDSDSEDDIEDSDDDEEDNEEDKPPPPKKVVKKRGVKKEL